MLDLFEAYSAAFKQHQEGHLVEAKALYHAILAEESRHAATHHLLGLVEHQLGRHEAALVSIGRAIELDDSEPHFHNNLGTVYRALRRPEEAARSHARALALKPDLAEAHSNLGLALQEQGQWAAAQRAFEQALLVKPGYAKAHYNLGNVLAARAEPQKAVDHFLEAIRSDPNFIDAYNNLGAVLAELGRLNEAAECYRYVLARQPANAAAHNNYGNVLARRDDLAAAARSVTQALALQPDYVEALVNLGNVTLEQGEPGAAAAAYARALELDPENDSAHWNQGLALLLQGKLRSGWLAWRRNVAAAKRFKQQEWRGGELAGATILIHAEQGFGDTIQFARYLPLVAQRGGRVIVEAPTELHRLLAAIEGVDAVHAFGDALPDFAWQCPLLSLPLAFDTTLDTIPAQIPYLAADGQAAEEWRRRLARPGLKVGLVWAGNPGHKRDRHRSLPLSALAPLAGVADVSFFALQKGAAVEEANDAPPFLRLEMLSPLLADFADTAAAIMALDLVISVDTSVAHLAGALGKPLWLLLPYAPDWRWLETRADSRWYPTARLYRQDASRRWAPVIARLAEELRFLAEGGIRHPLQARSA